MSNLFLDLERQKFNLNNLGGLNEKRSAKSQIEFVGEFDEFTIRTVYEHYEVIANNLKVYPTVTIYDRSRQLEGEMGGFYHSERHHVEVLDQYYIISMLAHEMRHAFQYVYFPDLFFGSSYRTTQQYLDCKVERDAREYAIVYCEANGLHEEKVYLLEQEEQMELIIQNKISPSSVGLNEQYFRENPKKAQDFDREKGHVYEETTIYYDDGEGDYEYDYEVVTQNSGWLLKSIKWTLGGFFLLFLMWNFFFANDEGEKVNLSSNQEQYMLKKSATEYLTDEDLSELSKEKLRIARNEIYARHGFIFGEGELNDYFLGQTWYEPNPDYADSLLSEIEHKNISIIQQYEK